MPVGVSKVLIPNEPFMDAEAIIRAVENALEGAAKSAKVDFDATTRTWDKRPEFIIKRSVGIRIVSTQDLIYFFLDVGTSVRYATMSPDFSPKTRHGYLGSNKGKGGKLFVSRKYPRPGIEPREFSKTAKEKWDAELPTILQRAIDAEVSRQNRSGSHAI